MTKAPSRIHVYLEGTDEATRNDGTVIKNRQILVKDTILNAYITQTTPLGNRTLGQRDLNDSIVRINEIQWRAPYEVAGPCADIHIDLPPFNFEGNPAGNKFDNSNYPPKEYMITSSEGPVNYSLGSNVTGLIDNGPSGERDVRERLELKNSNSTPGDAITADVYKANVGDAPNKDIAPFVTIRTNATDVTPNKHSGSYTISTAVDGVQQNAFHLEDDVPYFPINDVSAKPILSFNQPNQSSKPAIYYLESAQPEGALPTAPPGSLCLKNNGTLWFKTGTAAADWKRVELRE